MRIDWVSRLRWRLGLMPMRRNKPRPKKLRYETLSLQALENRVMLAGLGFPGASKRDLHVAAVSAYV